MDQHELEELAECVRKIVQDNKKFLEKVMDEDFDPEDEAEADPPEDAEDL